jgi:hypothetical protein
MGRTRQSFSTKARPRCRSALRSTATANQCRAITSLPLRFPPLDPSERSGRTSGRSPPTSPLQSECGEHCCGVDVEICSLDETVSDRPDVTFRDVERAPRAANRPLRPAVLHDLVT